MTILISEIVIRNIGEMERDQLGDEVFLLLYCYILYMSLSPFRMTILISEIVTHQVPSLSISPSFHLFPSHQFFISFHLTKFSSLSISPSFHLFPYHQVFISFHLTKFSSLSISPGLIYISNELLCIPNAKKHLIIAELRSLPRFS